MSKTELINLKLLIEICKKEGIYHFKKDGLELYFEKTPKPFEKKDGNPIINEPDFYNTDSWMNDKGSN